MTPLAHLRPVVGLALCCLALLLPNSLHARGDFSTAGTFVFDSSTKTEAQVYSPFEGLPTHGFLPVKVYIRNGFDSPRVWDLSFRSSCIDSVGNLNLKFLSSFNYSVPAGGELEDEIMVPLSPILRDYLTNNKVDLTISLRGGRSYSGEINFFNLEGWPMTAMSEGVDGKSSNLKRLTDHVHKGHSLGSSRGSSEPVAVLFEPMSLPRDWRGYTGFDVLMLSDQEWLSMEPAVRRATLEWVRFGGALHIFTKGGVSLEEIADLDGLKGQKGDLGLGAMFLQRWDGDTVNVSKLTDQIASTDTRRRTEELGQDYADRDWKLQRDFGTRPFNPVFVFVILVAFAIAVGPVNLFVLAKPGMRHRLFVTTPAISLAASLLLILIIVFQDGFGGSGRRVALMMVESSSDYRSSYVVQEQITRTGVLLGRSFEMEDDGFVIPVVMDNTQWTHFDSRELKGTYRLLEDGMGGDWFKSRSEQALFSQCSRPTRARIERLDPAATGAPRLFSSMDLKMDRFFYVDSDGKIWEAQGSVTAGQEIELKDVDRQDLEAFWANACAPFSESLRERIRALSKRQDLFLAVASGQRDTMIPTLNSLRWKNDQLLIVGSPIARESNPSTNE